MDWIDFTLKLPNTAPAWIFFLVLLIVLFAPILFTKLRIPHIIGMILAELAIDEHRFNILVRDSSFELFGKVEHAYVASVGGYQRPVQGRDRRTVLSVAYHQVRGVGTTHGMDFPSCGSFFRCNDDNVM